jgi:hypothetical protein
MTAAKIVHALRTPSFWLAAFILVSLIVGLNIFRDFGISFDEPGIYHFAPVMVDMYSTAFDPPEKPVFQQQTFLHTSRIPTDLFNYGPFYFVATEIFVRGMLALGIQIPYWDLWHLAYFLTFEASLVIFYLLCCRWLAGWASLAVTVLFATQPLILGHVFMNPKDIPFMIFFMASIWSGLLMVDRLRYSPAIQPHMAGNSFYDSVRIEWQSVSREAKLKAKRALLIWGVVSILFLLAMPVLDAVVQKSISVIYSAPPASLPGNLLRVFSGHPENIPLENFLTKSHVWIQRIEILVVLLLVGRALWIMYFLLPLSGQRFTQALSLPIRLFFRFLFNPFVILAGVLLGLTSSIRMFAPLAGALVLVYLIWKGRWKSILPAAAYGLIAVITFYLTWPYLWGEPIKRILKNWQVMNAFSHPGSPWALPTLLGIQYTEPAVLLTLAGFVIAIMEWVRGRRSGLLFLFLGWSILPMIVLMVKHASLYNNFRQVLFIVPPFFIIAGLAIDRILEYFHRPYMTAAFILLILLPGLWANVRLHPYEYIYYNQFVGGVRNASRHYEVDYWAVSLQEAARYLNDIAPANSTIVACAPVYTLEIYLRPDLRANFCDPNQEPSPGDYDYYVASGYGYINIPFYPQAKVVFSVYRENVPITVVKSLK